MHRDGRMRKKKQKSNHISKYSYVLIFPHPQVFRPDTCLLATSGTRAAVHNTRDHAKNYLCTERGRTCDICVTPSLLLWQLPNSLTDGCDWWGIEQLEHPGEPLKLVASAPAADAAARPSLKHPMEVGRNLKILQRITWTDYFYIFLHIVINEPLTKHLWRHALPEM